MPRNRFGFLILTVLAAASLLTAAAASSAGGASPGGARAAAVRTPAPAQPPKPIDVLSASFVSFTSAHDGWVSGPSDLARDDIAAGGNSEKI
jgi:hypothetical protein